VKNYRVEVDTIRPSHGPMVDADLRKEFGIAQGLEHRPPQFVGKVDVSYCTVMESES
jgi:hypothetical protein